MAVSSIDRVRSNLDHIVFFILVIALWELLVPAGSTVPAPGRIGNAMVLQFQDGRIIDAIWAALGAIFVGYFIAILVGIPLGVAMGVNRHAENIFDPYVNALYVVPFGALVPAMVIWFGTGLRVRVVVIFFFSLFPIVINSLEGAKTVPVNLVETVRSFGAGRLFIVRNVVLPYETAYIVAGLRLGIGRAVKGLVVTEVLISVSGFGNLLHEYSIRYDMAAVVSIVVVLMVLGVILTGALKAIENRVVHWEMSET